MSAPHRTGTAKAGPMTASLVPCSKSKWHRHHPANEPCGECPPPEALPEAPEEPDYWVEPGYGAIFDLALPHLKAYAGAPGFVRLKDVQPFSDLAKKICGCSVGGSCSYWYGSTYIYRAHEAPQLVKEPGTRAPVSISSPASSSSGSSARPAP